MTTSRVHHPRPESPERTERAGPVASRPAAGPVLALQRWAGNRAVTAMLARDTKTDAPPSKVVQYTLKVPDVGAIELESWSLGQSGRGGGGHGSGKVSVTDVTVSSLEGPHSPELARATATGKPLGTVVLEATKDGKVYMRITLHEAQITSYQLSGHGDGSAKPREQWTLNASKIDYEYMEQPKAANAPG